MQHGRNTRDAIIRDQLIRDLFCADGWRGYNEMSPANDTHLTTYYCGFTCYPAEMNALFEGSDDSSERTRAAFATAGVALLKEVLGADTPILTDPFMNVVYFQLQPNDYQRLMEAIRDKKVPLSSTTSLGRGA